MISHQFRGASISSQLARLDYRRNLKTDRDNPILVQKAWRDRFSGASHWRKGQGGEAYLGRPNGEDALTWNVFRSLQETQRLDLLAAFLMSAETGQGCKPSLGRAGTLLFWGCATEPSGYDAQQKLSSLIRLVDGQLGGTMTECDLVFITDTAVAVIEVKLNVAGSGGPLELKAEARALRSAGACIWIFHRRS